MRNSTKQKLFSNGGWAVFTVIVWEFVEEGLENLITYALSSAAAIFTVKLLSTLTVITATQGVKLTLKAILTPLFKRITYKEGNDKVDKLKKILNWFNANKCTILGIATGGVVTFSGAGFIDVNAFPALVIHGYNITPLIYYVVLGALAILASFFPETYEKFVARIATQKADKEARAIKRQALKEVNAELKANDESVLRAAEDRKARVEAEKAKLLQEMTQKGNK